jgi:hypothetical protein
MASWVVAADAFELRLPKSDDQLGSSVRVASPTLKARSDQRSIKYFNFGGALSQY